MCNIVGKKRLNVASKIKTLPNCLLISIDKKEETKYYKTVFFSMQQFVFCAAVCVCVGRLVSVGYMWRDDDVKL